jgi:hypothetical protein
MVRRALDNSLMKRSQDMLPNEYYGPASAREQAVRALGLIEEHMAHVGKAIEHELREKEAISALSRLRREVTALQMQFVKARLEHFRGSADARQRARAAEVLDLLESRCETNLQDAEAPPSMQLRQKEAEDDRDQMLPKVRG